MAFHERLLRWQKPKPYVICSMLISIGGLMFGLETGCIGPITTMPQFVSSIGSFSSTVHGLIISSILIPAALSSFFAGSLSEHLGRPRSISIGALIFTIGTALEAGSNGLALLFVGRIITGIGEGLFLSVILVYVCEIAPPKERGVLANIQQFLTTLGLCAGYFICYGTVRIESISLSWRLPFAIQSLIALSYTVISAFFLPQSPLWLTARGRNAEADQVWNRLGLSGAEREKVEEAAETKQAAPQPTLPSDPASSITAIIPPPTITHSTTTSPTPRFQIISLLFTRANRTQTLLGMFLSATQQLTGIDGVLFYAPLLFTQAGLSSSSASFLASGISALLMMLITIPAFLLADRLSRRSMTLYGGLLISATMLSIGGIYAAHSTLHAHSPAAYAVIALIYLFALSYCATWAVTVRVLSSEIQPKATRAPASGLAQSANWAANWAVAFTTPILLARTAYGAYFLFGGCTLIATAVVAVWVPETKGRALEEIEVEFERRRERDLRGVVVGEVKKVRRVWVGVKGLVGMGDGRVEERLGGAGIELERR